MTSIVYSGTTLTNLLGGYDSSFCVRVTNPTKIRQGGVDLNVLYAGYDGITGNRVTQTGKILANGVDIASLFNKKNARITAAFTQTSGASRDFSMTGPNCAIFRMYRAADGTLVRSQLIQEGTTLSLVLGLTTGETGIWAVQARPGYLDTSGSVVR